MTGGKSLQQRERIPGMCFPGSLPQNVAPVVVIAGGATVYSRSSFSRCGAGCSNCWSPSKGLILYIHVLNFKKLLTIYLKLLNFNTVVNFNKCVQIGSKNTSGSSNKHNLQEL
jgi:hypothetical protein